MPCKDVTLPETRSACSVGVRVSASGQLLVGPKTRVPPLTAGGAIHDRGLLPAVNSGVRLNDRSENIFLD